MKSDQIIEIKGNCHILDLLIKLDICLFASLGYKNQIFSPFFLIGFKLSFFKL
jgi:hypothetical protein